MAANSVLLDFSIEASRVTDELSRKDIVKVIKENVEKYFGNLKMVYDMLVDDGYLCILSDNSGVIFTLRFFNEGLITLNIEYFKKDSDPQKISFEVGVKFFFFFTTSHFTFHSNRKEIQTGFVFRSCFALVLVLLCD
jgi:hypothetical protein